MTGRQDQRHPGQAGSLLLQLLVMVMVVQWHLLAWDVCRAGPCDTSALMAKGLALAASRPLLRGKTSGPLCLRRAHTCERADGEATCGGQREDTWPQM